MTSIPSIATDCVAIAAVAMSGTRAPNAASDAPPLNWLLTWLGQTAGEESAAAEATEPAPPAEPSAQQIPWLASLPTVPAFERILAGQENVAVRPSEEEKRVANSKSPDEEEDDPEASKEAVAVIPAPIALPVPIPVQEPVDTDPAKAVETVGSRKKELAQNVETQTCMPPAGAADKGEIIWSAKLVVKQSDVPVAERPKTAAAAGNLIETSATSKISLPNQAGSGDMQQPGEQHRDTEPSNRPVVQEAASKTSPDHGETAAVSPAPTARESAGSKHAKSNEPAFVAQPIPAAELPGHGVEEAPDIQAAAASGNDVDQATPLRPTQVARLEVNVPIGATGADGGAPLRLVVSQRGEQVDVRVRSWDPAVSPIEPERMQPLLHSLAEKGLASVEPSSGGSEQFNASSDQQNSSGFQERQQQNQERQQHQQAQHLRRQLRNVDSGSFDLGLIFGNGQTPMQGEAR